MRKPTAGASFTGMKPQLFASAIALVAGGVLLQRYALSLKVRIACSALLVLSVMLIAFYVIADRFTDNGVDESVLYHVVYGLEGAGFGAYGKLVIGTLLFFALGGSFLIWTFKKRYRPLRAPLRVNLAATLSLAASILVNPAVSDLATIALADYTDDLAVPRGHYHRPGIYSAFRAPRHLVLVYAESLEYTYFDEQRFPGLVPGLSRLLERATVFTDVRQIGGAGWTIAGMVTSQCGLPLYTPSHGNSMSGVDEFLVSAVCLGDLLKEQGYVLHYYGGADTRFAGKGSFYRTHGFDAVKGLEQLQRELPDAPRDYASSWGLFDDTLLDYAYEQFVAQTTAHARFGLVLLTLDTHHDKGHPSASCAGITYGDGANPILNAVACSDRLLASFVDRIRSSPQGDETLIVIASDHLSLKNTAWDQLTGGPRRNLLMILDPERTRPRRIDTPGSLLDVGPTVLTALGFRNRLGFGRDLLDDKRDLHEVALIQEQLPSWRRMVTTFWDFPTITEDLRIDTRRRRLTIESRSFKIPALVEISPQLNTTLKFDFDRSAAHEKLTDYVAALGADQAFVLVDHCKKLRRLAPAAGTRGYCYLIGNARRREVHRVTGPQAPIGVAQIRDYLAPAAAAAPRGE